MLISVNVHGLKKGEAFQWNSHFLQIKKAWAVGKVFHGREGLDYLWWGVGLTFHRMK